MIARSLMTWLKAAHKLPRLHSCLYFLISYVALDSLMFGGLSLLIPKMGIKNSTEITEM